MILIKPSLECHYNPIILSRGINQSVQAIMEYVCRISHNLSIFPLSFKYVSFILIKSLNNKAQFKEAVREPTNLSMSAYVVKQW